MKASQLRDLGRKHAAGKIDRDDYVVERRKLIDAITRGDVDLEYRELDPPGSGGNSARSRPSRTALAAAGLIVVLLVAFAAHFLAGNGNAVESTESTPQAATATNPAVELLQEFAAADDWSDPTLESVETRWSELAEEDRERARQSVAYRRLVREVQTRIREHEALVSAGGSPDALMRAARLRMFAERLGFDG